MNAQELAALLNGRQYREEMTREEEKFAKTNKLLVLFGASDDLLEFRGVINDEASAWEGTTLYLDNKLNIVNPLDDYELPENFDPRDMKCRIDAIWCPEELDASWLIKVNVPSYSFDIMEDDDLYCRGVVIDLSINLDETG
jgi:hypothetical protein